MGTASMDFGVTRDRDPLPQEVARTQIKPLQGVRSRQQHRVGARWHRMIWISALPFLLAMPPDTRIWSISRIWSSRFLKRRFSTLQTDEVALITIDHIPSPPLREVFLPVAYLLVTRTCHIPVDLNFLFSDSYRSRTPSPHR